VVSTATTPRSPSEAGVLAYGALSSVISAVLWSSAARAAMWTGAVLAEAVVANVPLVKMDERVARDHISWSEALRWVVESYLAS
jgi:hypothetical protein